MDSLKELTSPPAMKAYTKGFLHLIPSSAKEKGKMPSMPVALVEMDNHDFVEYGLSRDAPQNTLNKEEFPQKYFPIEFAFSWVHLPKEEQPALPIFIVGAKVEDTAYRICEFKDEDEASQFIETTAKGLKNLATSVLKDNPQLLPFLAQISEFQVVHGIRVLLHRMPQKALSPEKTPFAYCIWWSHENLVFYAAPPLQVIPSKERERVLSGSIEKDQEYEKGLALLDVYLKYSNRLLKKPEPIEITIQGFDYWSWNLPNTTPLYALGRRVTSIFPTSIAGKEVTAFRIVEITPERKGFFGALRSGPPPKAVYAKYWNETRKGKGWLEHLLPINSRLAEAKDRLQILLDAFNSGPPTAYINAHYGPNIAASMLFFRKDFEGSLQSDEIYRMDEWKTIFKNTLFNKYGIAQKLPFTSLEERPYHISSRREHANAKVIWGVFKMNVYTEGSRTEYTWIWPDEFGLCFLDVVSAVGQTIGDEFLRSLDGEKEKAIRAISEKEGKETRKEAIKALLNKLEYFLARLQEK